MTVRLGFHEGRVSAGGGTSSGGFLKSSSVFFQSFDLVHLLATCSTSALPQAQRTETEDHTEGRATGHELSDAQSRLHA